MPPKRTVRIQKGRLGSFEKHSARKADPSQSLFDLRKALEEDGVMTKDDSFLDSSQYPISAKSEDDWTVDETLDDKGTLYIVIPDSSSSGKNEDTVLGGGKANEDEAGSDKDGDGKKGYSEKDNNDSAGDANADEERGAEKPLLDLPPLAEKPEGYDPAKRNTGDVNVTDEEFNRREENVEAGEVGVLRGIHQLDDKELVIVTKNASLGRGFDISSTSPTSSNRQAVVFTTDVHLHAQNISHVETVITYTARSASYAKSGWAKAAASVSTPWVAASVEASYVASEASNSAKKTIYVTGKYIYSQCTITLPAAFKLKPHPDFKGAVENALAINDPIRRTQELDKVFIRWGHVYAVSMELGGMKATGKKETDISTSDESSKEAELKGSISAEFGSFSGSIKGGAGGSTGRSNSISNQKESLVFDTIGGDAYTRNIDEWRKSLTKPETWNVIGVLQVESTIKLFDAELQSKIIAAQPHLSRVKPVYEFTDLFKYGSSKTERRYYTYINPPLRVPTLDLSQDYTISGWVSLGRGPPINHILFACLQGQTTLFNLEVFPGHVSLTLNNAHASNEDMVLDHHITNTIGRWIHVAAVQNVSQRRSYLYVNGLEKDRGSINSDYLDYIRREKNITYLVGPKYVRIGGKEEKDGKIAGVHIYRDAYDAGAVKKIYETTRPQVQP